VEGCWVSMLAESIHSKNLYYTHESTWSHLPHQQDISKSAYNFICLKKQLYLSTISISSQLQFARHFISPSSLSISSSLSLSRSLPFLCSFLAFSESNSVSVLIQVVNQQVVMFNNMKNAETTYAMSNKEQNTMRKEK